MKHSTQELKEIINNAPEGATHFTSGDDISRETYFKYIGLDLYQMWSVKNDRWASGYRPVKHIHSLSDIKEIIELRERLGE